MKKILIFCLITSFIITSVCFANEKTTTMTLDEAISYAMKNNANIIDIERSKNNQEKTYDKAKKNYRIWQGKRGYSFETPNQYLEYHGYSLELATLTYEKFLASEKVAKNTVSYSITKLAYSIEELSDTVKCLEKTIEKQENDVKVAEVKVKINMATQLDLDSAKSKLTSSKLQLESLKTSLDVTKITLKSIMGFDVLKELKITIPEKDFKLLEIEDIKNEIENSLKTNNDVITAKILYKQKDINNVLAVSNQLDTKNAVDDAIETFSDAELRLNNDINSVKENLLILYRQIKTNEEDVILAREDYEQLSQKYEQMKTMYELNMVTENDFKAYEVALLNSQNSYKSVLHKNILLNERWNIAMSVGDVVSNI